MKSSLLILLTGLLLLPSLVKAEETPANQYQTLLEQYEQEGGARTFAKRFIEFARQHASDPLAADALLWVVANVRGRSDTEAALELLAENHVQSDKLGSACAVIAAARSVTAEKLLRLILEKNKDNQTQAQACYHLAALLDQEASLVEQLQAEPELAPRVLQYYGDEYGKHLAALNATELTKQRELVYERLFKSFADVNVDDTTMGEIAERALFAIRHLSVGSTAPEIEGVDIHGERFKLSDYRGNIVLLSFWGHW